MGKKFFLKLEILERRCGQVSMWERELLQQYCELEAHHTQHAEDGGEEKGNVPG